MSSSKDKPRKSKKKQPSNIQITPPPNPSLNPFTNMYRPQLDDPMFSPGSNQALLNMGFTPMYYNQLPNDQFPTPLEVPYSQVPTPLEFPYSQVPTPLEVPYSQVPTPPETQNQNAQFMSRQPRRIGQSDTEEDEDDDVQQVEETSAEEEAPEDVRGKGQQRAKPLLWKCEEVQALAQSWIDISEDAAIGNNQALTAFKKRIWELWCIRMGRRYRNPAQIYSKWRNISKVAKDFEAIYDQGVRNWPSGATEADVLAKAKSLYDETLGKKSPFNVSAECFWQTIRQSEKWRKQKSYHEFAVGTKRAKTSVSTHSQSSDANVGFDINLEPEDVPSPMGRDRAKRKMRVGSGTTSNTSSQSSEGMRQLGEQIANLQTMQAQMTNVETQKNKNRLLQLCVRDISHLSGLEYKIAWQAKKEAAKDLGFTLDDE